MKRLSLKKSLRITKLTLSSLLVSSLFLIYSPFISDSYAQTDNYGTVKSYQKISDTEGSFTGTLSDDDELAYSISSIGDLDQDGVTDIAIGAPGDDDGGTNRGAAWIAFLNSNGTVKSQQKISDTAGNFSGTLNDGDSFGVSITAIGDLDNDSIQDIAVGAMYDQDGGTARGAVWILFLNSNGTVKAHQKISDTIGLFTGTLSDNDYFGSSVSYLGDLDQDNIEDLAVGAEGDDDGGTNRGAVWILFLDTDGTVSSYQKISDTSGSFTGTLDNGDLFGESISSIGNLNESGASDIAVGSSGDDDGGSNHGAVWILFLNTNGTVSSYQKISDTSGSFTGTLNSYDYFGCSLAGIDDMNGDNVGDLVVGAEGIFNGTRELGAVWVLFLNSNGTVKSFQKIDSSEGEFTGTYDEDDYFGSSVGYLGDLNGDEMSDIIVGARGNDDGGTAHGGGWVLYLNGYYENNIINVPGTLRTVLSSDWKTDVEINGQNGTHGIGIVHNSSQRRIAVLDVDFSQDRDWSLLSAGSTDTKTFFHYPGGFDSIPGSTGNGYTLYVPKGSGNYVGICPRVASLEDISDSCDDVYYLSEANDNVSISTENGVVYWKISGLTSSGGFSISQLPVSGSRTDSTTAVGLIFIITAIFTYHTIFEKKYYFLEFEKV